MQQLRNISPLGELEIPLVGRVVGAGEVFEVTDEQAALLLAQPSNFEPAEPVEASN